MFSFALHDERRQLAAVVRGVEAEAPTDDGNEPWKLSGVIFIDGFVFMRDRVTQAGLDWPRLKGDDDGHQLKESA